MPNQRSEGKRLIGAQASPELWDGVDKWLEKHPNATVTDFVLSAILDKLAREGIKVDSVAALRDLRSRSATHARVAAGGNRFGGKTAAGSRGGGKAASSKSTSPAEELLDAAAAAVEHPDP
jgi:hypothetical protein